MTDFHPVVWAPSHECVGSAATERRALALVRHISVTRLEARTATLRQDMSGRLTWYCGPVLAHTYGIKPDRVRRPRI